MSESLLLEQAAMDAELAPARRIVEQLSAELGSGPWDRDAQRRVRDLLRSLPPLAAFVLLSRVGFDPSTANTLSRVFTCDDAAYQRTIGKRQYLTLYFEKGKSGWKLTRDSEEELNLPFHPKTVEPLTPPAGLGMAQGEYKLARPMGQFVFESGVSAPALRLTLVFRGITMSLVSAEEVFRDDWSFVERIDGALSNIPVRHLAMIREIVIDPGQHPLRSTIAAVTNHAGTRVSLFLRGEGKYVSQEELNETAAHEFGHVVSSARGDRFWTGWDAAIEADRRAVSRYGLTNQREDFAETYVLYLGGGAGDPATRARFKNRFAIIDGLMGGHDP